MSIFSSKTAISNTSFMYANTSSYDGTTSSSSQTVYLIEGVESGSFGAGVAIADQYLFVTEPGVGFYHRIKLEGVTGSGSGTSFTNKLHETDTGYDTIAAGSGIVVMGNKDYTSNTGRVKLFTDYNFNGETNISPSDLSTGDYFGQSVAVGGGRFIVGAPRQSSNKGAVYIYNTYGRLIKKIEGGSAGDYYGVSVSIGDGRIAVGAPYAAGGGTQRGTVYLYDLNGTFISSVNGYANYRAYGLDVAVAEGKVAINYDNDTFNLYDLDFNSSFRQFYYSDSNQYSNGVAISNGRIAYRYKDSTNYGIAIQNLTGTSINDYIVDSLGRVTGTESIAIGNGYVARGVRGFNSYNGGVSIIRLASADQRGILNILSNR